MLHSTMAQDYFLPLPAPNVLEEEVCEEDRFHAEVYVPAELT